MKFFIGLAPISHFHGFLPVFGRSKSDHTRQKSTNLVYSVILCGVILSDRMSLNLEGR